MPLDHWPFALQNNTPRGIRTLNPQIRSLMRYPVAPVGHLLEIYRFFPRTKRFLVRDSNPGLNGESVVS